MAKSSQARAAFKARRAARRAADPDVQARAREHRRVRVLLRREQRLR